MFDIILKQAELLPQLGGIWIAFLLVFSRVLAFVSVAPLIGHKSIPSLVKIGFASLLTLLLFPNIQAPPVIPVGYKFVYAIAMNACIGLIIGWVAGLVIEIIKTAGEIINMEMALHAATLFDPGSQAQTTIIGKFFDMLGLVLFISIGGVEKIIEGLHKSFTVFPVILFEINLNVPKLIAATAEIITMGFLLISPIMMVLLLMDLILGLMSRAAPQINAFQVSFSIKPSLGLILLLLILPALFPILVNILSNPMKFFY